MPKVKGDDAADDRHGSEQGVSEEPTAFAKPVVNRVVGIDRTVIVAGIGCTVVAHDAGNVGGLNHAATSFPFFATSQVSAGTPSSPAMPVAKPIGLPVRSYSQIAMGVPATARTIEPGPTAAAALFAPLISSCAELPDAASFAESPDAASFEEEPDAASCE